jgi:hypothetical protein
MCVDAGRYGRHGPVFGHRRIRLREAHHAEHQRRYFVRLAGVLAFTAGQMSTAPQQRPGFGRQAWNRLTLEVPAKGRTLNIENTEL